MAREIIFRQYHKGIHTTFCKDQIVDEGDLEIFISEDGFEEKRIKELVISRKIIYHCMNCANEYESIDGIKMPCFDLNNICSLPEYPEYKKMRESRYQI